MATESAYFRRQQKENPNSMVNGKAEWQPDAKMEQKRLDAFERVQYELNSGILQQLRLKREQEINTIVMNKCFKNAELSFPQAEMCAEWVRQKDFKTSLINSFTQDHLAKHHLSYHLECVSNPAMQQMKTMEDKDRAYLTCNNTFIRRLKQEVHQELEVKARELFQ